MRNSPSDYNHYVIAVSMAPINTTTQLQIKGIMYVGSAEDPDFYYTLKYLSVDTVIYPNFEIIYRSL